MEEDLRIKKSQGEDFVKQRLEAVIEEAQERINKEAAASPEIRFALDIVEQFLHRKGRVCYGGTAMNAQLPKDLQFYSPEKDLPENARKLRGLVWRGDERIKSKDAIFPPEENIENDKLVKQAKDENAKENVPMKIRKETLNYDKKKKKK